MSEDDEFTARGATVAQNLLGVIGGSQTLTL